MILLIDNYDSFVFNLARYFVELGQKVDVVRNDRIDVDEVRRLNPDAIVFSPGPCGPDEAGNSIDLITKLSGDYPMLGVCLGHQSIARAFGGVVKRANRPVHGMTSAIDHNGSALFNGIKSPLMVTRYHSLVVDLPLDGTLVQTATGPDGEIMAFAHRDLPIFGVQFHPEAVLTEQGHDLLSNFLAIAGATVPRKAAS
ncbi:MULTISPECIES: anthranilate synthase component II [Thalassospira]|jgi:anthranilate synthase component 2/para-aminobenzoate synthetase component 2|uniref:Anthranilate synthase n=1 Tax=Thalassospira xiamenensis TaxID=220697 RepID=A0ABR5XXE2_9PROT|nr:MULTISPECIES: aminodeoxychorismate/anthranilate synthase component II [Thalassospira]MBL4843742.1 aminodeoxychorismate/anthranilate synthase component II [Thalassospira sp.]MBR9778904.1 aminodeoxychorismate/anthranilate synthase component II [Rhodospirillales bacterium]KZC97090.1 anthranilate synthase [Thalassospira xiamenensis]KZD08040.1 anthranilate synthase [Thalassospira xiamenensis]MBR9818600.1 aminodeoxychorismate/anthranilate synthase component II [Rhodospirillales bacterium]|tara:strand:- start:1478 stop:2071 length:594 start_codon:yes stop_codon:yes gene_type:complete